MEITKTAFGRLTLAKVKDILTREDIVIIDGYRRKIMIGKAPSGGLITPVKPTETPQTVNRSGLFVNPKANVNQFTDKYPDLKVIASQPQATWLGEWSGDVGTTVREICDAAKAQGKIASFVVYMIPGRDMGSFSAGGSKSPDAYKAFVISVANNIAPGSIVILEPDAIVHDAKSESDKLLRYQLISFATKTLADKGARVYIDGGHARWHSADEAARRLFDAGVKDTTGFSLNVSNFVTTAMSLSYGKQISEILGSRHGVHSKHFVIDTSRNGADTMPPNGVWCNPANVKLGIYPTLNTGEQLCDGFLWIKAPGESDGLDGWITGISAGQFLPQFALAML